MASASGAVLFILNIIHSLFALAVTAASIWFFVEVQSITNLRNPNHYRLNYEVYWPQVTPWIFIIVSVLALIVSCCGFGGVKRRSRGLLSTFIVFELFVVVACVAATIVALVYADSAYTDNFVHDTIWDVFQEMKTDRDVEEAFGQIERRFQCCGSDGPRNYIGWRAHFPVSCCDTYYHGFVGNYPIDCDITSRSANERFGCTQVVAHTIRIGIRVFSGASALLALIGVFNVIAAVITIRNMKRKPRVLAATHEADSKKVLL